MVSTHSEHPHQDGGRDVGHLTALFLSPPPPPGLDGFRSMFFFFFFFDCFVFQLKKRLKGEKKTLLTKTFTQNLRVFSKEWCIFFYVCGSRQRLRWRLFALKPSFS